MRFTAQGFRTAEEVQRFSDLMDEMCYIVATKHSGSLKACAACLHAPPACKPNRSPHRFEPLSIVSEGQGAEHAHPGAHLIWVAGTC